MVFDQFLHFLGISDGFLGLIYSLGILLTSELFNLDINSIKAPITLDLNGFMFE